MDPYGEQPYYPPYDPNRPPQGPPPPPYPNQEYPVGPGPNHHKWPENGHRGHHGGGGHYPPPQYPPMGPGYPPPQQGYGPPETPPYYPPPGQYGQNTPYPPAPPQPDYPPPHPGWGGQPQQPPAWNPTPPPAPGWNQPPQPPAYGNGGPGGWGSFNQSGQYHNPIYDMANSNYYRDYYDRLQRDSNPFGQWTQQNFDFGRNNATPQFGFKPFQPGPDAGGKLPPAGIQDKPQSYDYKEVSKFQRLWRDLSARNARFTDEEFKACPQSIVGDDVGSFRQKHANRPWLRPERFFGGKAQVFLDKIEPNDIIQGELGDCYFLSSLASLAEIPNRIERLFITKEANQYGIFCVVLCNRGEWQEVVVDDQFPCLDETRGPVFSKGHGCELWVLILEKAWAKIHGSYQRIEAGLSREALRELTGAPTRPIFMDNPNLFQEIKEAARRKWVMTAGTSSQAEKGKSGLVSSHAYSILDALEVQTYQGPVRLVKIRNPWGNFEWNGDWSDSSPLWTPELKRQLGWQQKNDGIFFMSLRDFMVYYNDLQICQVEDQYKYCAIKTQSSARNGVYFLIRVRTEGEYFFTINQESKRKFPENSGYQYSPVRILLARVQSGDITPINGVSKAEMEVWTSGYLKPGDYYLYSKIDWRNSATNEATLSSYGPDEVTFSAIPKTSCPNFQVNFFKKWAQTNGQRHDYNPNCARYYQLTPFGYGYWYYLNKSDRVLEEEITLTGSTGIRFKRPHTQTSARVTVPPGTDAIVLAVIGTSGYKVSINYRTRY